MAEILGIITSALAVGECAGQLGFALGEIYTTLKNAPQEIKEIARGVRTLSIGLLVLAGTLKAHRGLCKPDIFTYLDDVLVEWKDVEAELRSLTTIEDPSGLRRLKWVIRKPKTRVLLKKVESIKASLNLGVGIMNVAKEEISKEHFIKVSDESSVVQITPASDLPTSNKFRRIAESVVQENRQAVEDAQRGDQTISVAESELQSGGQLKLWRADSIDTATWLYQLVFNPHSAGAPSLSPSEMMVPHIDEDEPDGEPDKTSYTASHAIIRWDENTRPASVVDRLLRSWTTLTEDQIKSSAIRDYRDQWGTEVEEAREEQKLDDVNPRFNKLLGLLLEQQEHYALLEKEKQDTTTRTDEDLELKILKLEQLLHTQQEEQSRRHEAAESAWRAEKVDWDAKAAERAQELKTLAEQEIAAAKAAEKSARKALKFAKAEAAKKAKEEAEAKAAAERLKVDEDYKRRIQLYEEQLEIFYNGHAERKGHIERSVPAENQPLRRTCIIDGDRSIEVAEYTTEKLEPFINTSQFPSQCTAMFQDGLHHGNASSLTRSKRTRPGSDAHRRQSSRNSWTSIDSMRSPASRSTSGTANNASQQIIVFPSQIDRSSTKISKMQASLDKHGVLASFEEQDDRYDQSLTRLSSVNEDIVRSTIFWEPPLLTLGSELLRTPRTTGWKPFYVRASNIGQTYFLGDQPIHVNFFQPEYKPQLAASTSPSRLENVMVGKDLLEEYALRELGFRYRLSDKGGYILDCRLSAVRLDDTRIQMHEN
ncbi:hypothetical protein K491DRAFT_612710 [Lophiostoma macrostomum CBS 122681]|uniref:Fungal N-terminal domain-containing protein n=1 Tax=Lophiostoma macrostomum CBS 122681 TaxID=1314788 RepID=A0A6A6SPD5_9PLEO|nr:hypothetical protein K491DRAFT_612710 [Lophiostoma macrostomum CBS 122681]